MQVQLSIVLDLGPFGDRAEQIRDAVTAARAVKEALVWHGTLELFDVYDHTSGEVLFDRDGLAQPPVLRGVEWGGR